MPAILGDIAVKLTQTDAAGTVTTWDGGAISWIARSG
jgi:hypothetical protein